MLGLPAARSAFQRASKSPVRPGRQLDADAVQLLELAALPLRRRAGRAEERPDDHPFLLGGRDDLVPRLASAGFARAGVCAMTVRR